MEWLANNESSLSAIAAIIAIIAGVAVVTRLIWTRMPAQVMSQVKRPAFLSDWRNIALMGVTFVALLLAVLMATGKPDEPQNSREVARLTKITGKPSVAVLPLNYIGEDQSQTYLADGIAEDVITLLSRNPRFFVIARNSSFTYKGKAIDIRQVGEELGVRYVVEGSVRKTGERLRVTVQLIDASNGQHIWAEQYDRPFAKIFELQDEITNGIAVALGDEIFQAEMARASAIPTDNLDAWGLVVRGSQAVVTWNRESSTNALALFRAALDLDPDYALAKAEVARSLCWRAVVAWSDDAASDIAKAYTLGREALKAAPNDPMVMWALGGCYGLSGRTEEGIRLLEKAISKQPNYPQALAMLGEALMFDGQSARGLPYIDKAILLSPKSPYMYFYEFYRTMALCELDRYIEAEQAGQNSLKSYDGLYWSWLVLAWARAGQGNIEGAKQALYGAKTSEPRFSLDLVRESTGIIFKNKGKNLLALLEPIWPEDLKTADHDSGK
ncbi:MAG: hypothetical protein DRR06_14310 [Gammaproteobacteria bacterium]|nr:MAG: hypothetical protein DRR06_14310 [Gammaproteobacteria bacterium]